jgi:hypothetical protein
MQPIQNQPYNTAPDTPACNHAGTVWAHPVSLAATQGVEVSFLSSGYLDVSVRPLTFSQPIYSAEDDQTLLWPGFPIRRSAGRRLFSASPRLIAAVRVLHRLLVPRHPPCALSILTEIHTTLLSLCRFQGARGAVLRWLEEPRHSQARSFKTEQRCPEKRTIRRSSSQVDVLPGFHIHRGTDAHCDRIIAG